MLVVDTGVLLRAINRDDPNFDTIKQMFRALRQAGEPLCTFPQNVAEFWAVCTRPVSANGYGLSVEEAFKRLALLERVGVVIPEHSDAYEHWKKLVLENQVQGKPTHDSRIVAQMVAHGFANIITLNPRDFQRYDCLKVRTPEQVLASE